MTSEVKTVEFETIPEITEALLFTAEIAAPMGKDGIANVCLSARQRIMELERQFGIRSNDGGLRCGDFLADVAEVFARHRVRVYENEFDETVLHHETHEDGCSWLLVLEDFVDSLKSSQEKRGD